MPLTTAMECLRLVSKITQTNLSLLIKQSFMVIMINNSYKYFYYIINFTNKYFYIFNFINFNKYI